MFVRRLRILAVRVRLLAVPVVIVVARLGLVLREPAAGQAGSAAALKLKFSLVAHALEFRFLLLFQFAANLRVLALSVPALAKLIVEASMQCIDLIVEIASQISAGVWEFGLTRGTLTRRSHEEGTNDEGISDPGAFHGVYLLVHLLFGSPENTFAAFDL